MNPTDELNIYNTLKREFPSVREVKSSIELDMLIEKAKRIINGKSIQTQRIGSTTYYFVDFLNLPQGKERVRLFISRLEEESEKELEELVKKYYDTYGVKNVPLDIFITQAKNELQNIRALKGRERGRKIVSSLSAYTETPIFELVDYYNRLKEEYATSKDPNILAKKVEIQDKVDNILKKYKDQQNRDYKNHLKESYGLRAYQIYRDADVLDSMFKYYITSAEEIAGLQRAKEETAPEIKKEEPPKLGQMGLLRYM